MTKKAPPSLLQGAQSPPADNPLGPLQRVDRPHTEKQSQEVHPQKRKPPRGRRPGVPPSRLQLAEGGGASFARGDAPSAPVRDVSEGQALRC